MYARLLGFAVAAVVCSLSAQTHAASLTYNFTTSFAGNSLGGTWLTAAFNETDTDEVTLTLSAGANLPSAAKVGAVYFNVDPSVLSLSIVNNPASTSVDSVSSYLQNAYQADGDGEYDFVINFLTSDANKFGSGSSATFVLTATGLLASSFDYLSNDAGGSGPFRAAAHFQNINTAGDSIWGRPGPSGGDLPPVPLPAAAWTGLSALAGLGLIGRIRRRMQRD